MKIKKFVLTHKGYTLLESIIGMFVLSIIILQIMNLVLVMNKSNIENYHTKNISLLINKIDEDFLLAKEIKINANKLEINTLKDEKIVYKIENNKLKRTINEMGNEILIYNIKSGYFFNKNGIFLKIDYGIKDESIYLGKVKI